MKKFFENLGYKIQVFMQGRYGIDELSRFLTILSLILLLLSALIRPLRILYFPALALMIWSWYRSLSKNIYKRQRELEKYLEIKDKIRREIKLIKDKYRDRGVKHYYRCPNCKRVLRTPEPPKHTTVSITCPMCGYTFSKKT